MELGKIYFYTSTILNWQLLLQEEKFKLIIVDSLTYLHSKKLINVYGFVIMPNHIHLIWEMNVMNGKEYPYESFKKFTGHAFKKMIIIEDENKLKSFKVNDCTREYQFWERDSLPIELYSREVLEQKLDYIHHNPVQGKWRLCEDYVEYKYSSASFYETGKSDFSFLTHYMDRL